MFVFVCFVFFFFCCFGCCIVVNDNFFVVVVVVVVCPFSLLSRFIIADLDGHDPMTVRHWPLDDLKLKID